MGRSPTHVGSVLAREGQDAGNCSIASSWPYDSPTRPFLEGWVSSGAPDGVCGLRAAQHREGRHDLPEFSNLPPREKPSQEGHVTEIWAARINGESLDTTYCLPLQIRSRMLMRFS